MAIKWYDESDAERLEKVLGYKFKKIELLHQAIQGTSFLPALQELDREDQ